MKLISQSLFAKIFVAIAAAAVLVVMVMALVVALSMREGFAQYLLRGELTRFDGLVAELAAEDADGWAELGQDPRLWHDFIRAHFMPRGADFAQPSGRPPNLQNGPPPPPAGRGDTLLLEDRLVLLDAEGRVIAGPEARASLFEQRPVCTGNDCASGALLGYLGLNAPRDAVGANDAFFLRGQYASLALSALGAIAISAVAAYLIAAQLLGPIRRLAAGAKTMAAGNYTARIRQDRRDELGQLIGHYNTLAATLEHTAKAEREWISNTSHELQTPLAVLRAQIEALQDGIRQADTQTLSEMHAALMRLSRLVQDIKTLSYAREAELATRFATGDLSAIVRQSADAAAAALADKGITLGLDLPETAPLRCDPEQMGQVIDNLLSNAARYTDAPGRVRLTLHQSDGVTVLTVEDTPPAPPPADLSRLFDRFFRVESSRSRAFGGSGLGLSVCKAIVEAHGGSIITAQSELGGLEITIRLPDVPE